MAKNNDEQLNRVISLKLATLVLPGFSAGDLCDAVHGTVTYDGPEDDNWDQQGPSNECCADVRVSVSAPVNTEPQRQRPWRMQWGVIFMQFWGKDLQNNTNLGVAPPPQENPECVTESCCKEVAPGQFGVATHFGGTQ